MKNTDHPMGIAAISMRTVLNSHARPTPEFVVTLDNGSQGCGSAPAGETLSRSEQRLARDASDEQIRDVLGGLAGLLGAPNQATVDGILRRYRCELGANVTLGISVAYLDATARTRGVPPYEVIRSLAGLDGTIEPTLPTLLLNVLNGGAYARTNPVLSDFPEYLLVPRSRDLDDYLPPFLSILEHIRRRLSGMDVVEYEGLSVHVVPAVDNRVWIELVLDVLEELGLGSEFNMMIDASAGDLERDGRYHLERTTGEAMDSEEFAEYWAKLAADYPLTLIEDPFSEDDFDAWARLRETAKASTLVGDNLCSTDAATIERAAKEGLVGAVLIKPNQAGTVTDVIDATTAARNNEVEPIPSHRSIETDSAWLADVCAAFGPNYAKLGLISDFETIQKINRLVRYTNTHRSLVP